MSIPSIKEGFIVACASLLLAGAALAQQPYPAKPVRLIVPNPPGGGATNMARLIGDKLSENLGVPFIIDNKAGANGFIGGEALAKSPADGYTIMVASSTHIITPLLFPAPYDAIKDFTPIANVGKTELVMVVHPSVPAYTLQEFIALAKSKPGAFNYGSSGAGSINRLAGALFDMTTGTKMQNISYKGSAQATTDLLGGQIQLSFNVPSATVPFVQAGKLRALAVSGDARISALPQTPTFGEAGVPVFNVSVLYGFLAPAGTPRAVIDKLASEMAKLLATQEVRDKIAAQGVEPHFTGPDQFSAQLKSDTANFAKIIKTANIKADE